MSDIVEQIAEKLLHGAGDTEVRHVLWDARQEIERLRGDHATVVGAYNDACAEIERLEERLRGEGKRVEGWATSISDGDFCFIGGDARPFPSNNPAYRPATLILHTGASDG